MFCDSVSPPYIRVASPTAASLRGQLLKIRLKIRLTAGPEADRRGPWNSEPDFHIKDMVPQAMRGGGAVPQQEVRHSAPKR